MTDTEPSNLRKGQGPKVAIAQIDPKLGDLTANMELHREAIARAKTENVDLLVFPELSLTGYRLKDSVPDVALTRQCPEFLELADASVGLSIVAGLVLESAEHFFFNSAVYFEEGKAQFVHRKVYLPTYGMFDEQRYFARGNRVTAFATKHGRVAILICEDMLHPSAVTIAALDGASVIVVPSASPARGVAGEGAVDANGRVWEEYNHTMARTYGLFVVHANRAGVEDGHTFWGGSEIIGPDGETLAKAAYYQADFVSAVLSESLQRRQRLQAPLLRDEDVDLTINELCRLRGRERPGARPPQRQDSRPPRRYDDREQKPYRFGGGQQRDRGRDRGGPPRERQSQGGRSWQGVQQGYGRQGESSSQPRSYGQNPQERPNRKDGRDWEDRRDRQDRRVTQEQPGRQDRHDRRGRDDRRGDPERRERPDPGERRSRQASEVARETFLDDGDDYLD
jgi:NAD+ synthase (glutamine-hydrolysing)